MFLIGEWSTTQVAIAQHAIAPYFFDKINCSTQKIKLLNQLNPFFEQFLFSKCSK
jgi:hypothetical protein